VNQSDSSPPIDDPNNASPNTDPASAESLDAAAIAAAEQASVEAAAAAAALSAEAEAEIMATSAAVILAAGEGSRFAGDNHKLLTKLDKKPIVTWAVEHALSAGFAETIVVSGCVDLSGVVPEEATLLMNHDWADGQARSLQVALTYATMAGHRAVVVGLGDQPLAPPEAWRAVALTPSPIATAEFAGVQTPPVRLDGDVWGLVPIEGDEGAKAIIRRRPELVVAVPCEGYAIDVDTLTDLQKVRSLVKVDQASKEGRTWN